ncbi:hypothetical protein ACD591_03725 [Rufibacter glacialis]|uniref:Uncharacterized protein n=1 Tax=Rufibacter glacialis TaxID=1259555 RepID=A0A5M8QHM6_9BACT|nr:hypothetical protein [Rufibacter glacialis]KAA6434474.1 hypothetical protein FOE74_09795 [Rufibacter glacialis]GGK69965.1 hypothetical protein GCM10011405_17500 [Rufibacter glacialis]
MDKLTTYNQRLLAIIGTLIVGSLLVIVLIGVFLLGSDLFRSRSSDDSEESSSRDSFSLRTSATRPEETKKQQTVTFESPDLLDSAKQLYLIPVSMTNPDQENDTDTYTEIVTSEVSSSRSEYRNYQGTYRNIIIYNQPAGNNQVVFNKLVHINDFRSYQLKGNYFLLIKASAQDTDKNGSLNNNDLQAFYLYDVEAKQLQEISFPHMGLKEYTILHGSDEISLTFGVDQNQNGKLREEPTVLKKYSLTTRNATDLLDTRLVKQLQQIGI